MNTNQFATFDVIANIRHLRQFIEANQLTGDEVLTLFVNCTKPSVFDRDFMSAVESVYSNFDRHYTFPAD